MDTFSDIQSLLKVKSDYPFSLQTNKWVREIAFPNHEKLGHFVVLNAVVDVLLMVTSPQALQEIYIDKNRFHTKSETEKVRTGNLIKDSLILAESDDPTYKLRR
jgi:hypothetical protein